MADREQAQEAPRTPPRPVVVAPAIGVAPPGGAAAAAAAPGLLSPGLNPPARVRLSVAPMVPQVAPVGHLEATELNNVLIRSAALAGQALPVAANIRGGNRGYHVTSKNTIAALHALVHTFNLQTQAHQQQRDVIHNHNQEVGQSEDAINQAILARDAEWQAHCNLITQQQTENVQQLEREIRELEAQLEAQSGAFRNVFQTQSMTDLFATFGFRMPVASEEDEVRSEADTTEYAPTVRRNSDEEQKGYRGAGAPPAKD